MLLHDTVNLGLERHVKFTFNVGRLPLIMIIGPRCSKMKIGLDKFSKGRDYVGTGSGLNYGLTCSNNRIGLMSPTLDIKNSS